MNKNTTIGDAIKHLDQNIEKFRGVRLALEALIHPGAGPTDPSLPPTSPASAVNAATHARTGQSVATAAIGILEAAQRPLHGLTEIAPALEAAAEAESPSHPSVQALLFALADGPAIDGDLARDLGVSQPIIQAVLEGLKLSAVLIDGPHTSRGHSWRLAGTLDHALEVARQKAVLDLPLRMAARSDRLENARERKWILQRGGELHD